MDIPEGEKNLKKTALTSLKAKSHVLELSFERRLCTALGSGTLLLALRHFSKVMTAPHQNKLLAYLLVVKCLCPLLGLAVLLCPLATLATAGGASWACLWCTSVWCRGVSLDFNGLCRLPKCSCRFFGCCFVVFLLAAAAAVC